MFDLSQLSTDEPLFELKFGLSEIDLIVGGLSRLQLAGPDRNTRVNIIEQLREVGALGSAALK